MNQVCAPVGTPTTDLSSGTRTPSCTHATADVIGGCPVCANFEAFARECDARRAEWAEWASVTASVTVPERTRVPVPDGLEKCDTGRYPFLLLATTLSPLATDVAMAALDSAMFNEPTRRGRQRVSGIRLPASLLAREWGINPNEVRRAINECVQAEVLHIEDGGHFVSTSNDPEPMRSMRVILVGNKAGMRAAGRAFKRSGYAADPSASGDSTSAGTSRTGSPSGDQRRFNVLTTDATVSAMEAGAC
jgi:hypothetical protein